MATRDKKFTRPLVMFGSGGHAKVVLDAAFEGRRRPSLIVDDAPRSDVLRGVPVVCSAAPAWQELSDFGFVVAVGCNRDRARLFELLLAKGGVPESVIHPSALISRCAIVGAGSVCLAGSIVNSNANVGDNVIINTAASVDHDARLGAHAHIAPGVRLAGQVSVGAGSLVGLGAILLPGVTVGEWSVVGAGSVVTRNLPSGVLAYGTPARVIKAVA